MSYTNPMNSKKKGLGTSYDPMDKLGFNEEATVYTPPSAKPDTGTVPGSLSTPNPGGMIGQPTVGEATASMREAVSSKVTDKLKKRKEAMNG